MIHNVNDPFVDIWVHSLCDKIECEKEARQEIRKFIKLTTDPQGVQNHVATLKKWLKSSSCVIYGEKEKTMKCTHCKIVAWVIDKKHIS